METSEKPDVRATLDGDDVVIQKHKLTNSERLADLEAFRESVEKWFARNPALGKL